MTTKLKQARYAAKLLFQFRVIIRGNSAKRRTCEERIVVLEASSATAALRKAQSNGKRSENSYRNNEGNQVRFEFIGVMELLKLDPECGPDEVWYDIRDRVLPSERRDKLIPTKSKLNAIWHEQQAKSRK